MESACQSFQMLLSAYADGEVSGKARSQVELHLAGCADCRARVADLKALSAVVSQRIAGQVEEVDFSGFADSVLKKVSPAEPSFLERLRIAWAELLAYHRAALVSSLVTAAVTLAIAVPLAYRLAASQSPEVIVRELQLEDPSVRPVVMNMGDGRTLIMLVGEPGADEESETPDLSQPPPTEGDL